MLYFFCSCTLRCFDKLPHQTEVECGPCTVAVEVILLPCKTCSDGLSEYVHPNRMNEVLRKYSLENAADVLLNLALEGGGRDNISVVLAEVEA